MTPTRRRAKLFVSITLLSCFFLPTVVHAQNDEQTYAWHVIEQFFAAFQQKDLQKVMALWSEKSPDLPAGKQSMQQTFATYGQIEVKSLRPDKITVEKDKATIQLTAELSVVIGSTSTLFQACRTILMARENDAWKISRYVTAEEEFAAAVSAVRTSEEAGALLNTKPELVTPDLGRALTRQARELLVRGKQPEAVTINDLALSI